jgi:dihydrofolate synthase/folylpolyglutamate synthase
MLQAQSRLTVPTEAMAAGIRNTRWPARLQRLSHGPLVRAGHEVWLDGCHNPAGAELIAYHFNDSGPLHIICGILANKDAHGILAPFRGVAPYVTAVPIIGHPHHAPDDLVAIARDLGLQSTAAANIASALNETNSARVLIMGSFYLASEVLSSNHEWPD